jgi:uncharacterized membrane protein
MMISNHFSMTWGHAMNWLILVAMFLIGIGVDHFINCRDQGKKGVGYAALAAAVAGLVAVIVFTAAPASSAPGTAATTSAPVAFSTVQGIVTARCIECHSAHPTSKLFPIAPNGMKFDTSAEIRMAAAKIKLMAIDTQAMPLGNLTHMTVEERSILAAWLAQGAPIPPASIAQ